MNMQGKILAASIDWESCRHWLDDMPYRALVPIKPHGSTGAMQYQIAGIDRPECGALNSLKAALKKHGGKCFYCQDADATTIDHIEAAKFSGKSDLANLVVACQPCNAAKGHKTIDAYNPKAARKWLEALRRQVEIRLVLLEAGFPRARE